MKVEDLEKASESTNHENGRLRAQVERLNTEVKEYRKRLSLTATGVGRSPPTASPVPYNYPASNNDFQFAFPKFGDLPSSIFGSNGSLVKTSSPVSLDHGSTTSIPSLGRASSSQSPPTTSPTSIGGNYGSMPHGLPNAYRSPGSGLHGNGIDDLNGLFSPSVLESAKRNAAGDYGFTNVIPRAPTVPKKSSSADSYNALANLPNFNSTSADSPSASSMSHGGLESSCGTTPEPSADSPEYRKQSEVTLNTINEDFATASDQGKETLCREWAKECDKSINPVSRTMYDSNTPSAPSAAMKAPGLENGIDWLAQQNGGQFDPVLFGDYRDPQDNIMNSNLGEFFGDAFFAQDFGTPFNTGELLSEPQQSQQSMSPPAPPMTDLMKECEAAQNANDDPATVVKEEKPKQFIPCDKLWSVFLCPCDCYPSHLADLTRIVGIACKTRRKSTTAKSTWTISAASLRPKRNAQAMAR